MTGKNVLLCFCVVLALSRFPNSLESPETRRVCGNNSPGEISWQAETCLFFRNVLFKILFGMEMLPSSKIQCSDLIPWEYNHGFG
jgi:hypothetical protein